MLLSAAVSEFLEGLTQTSAMGGGVEEVEAPCAGNWLKKSKHHELAGKRQNILNKINMTHVKSILIKHCWQDANILN